MATLVPSQVSGYPDYVNLPQSTRDLLFEFAKSDPALVARFVQLSPERVNLMRTLALDSAYGNIGSSGDPKNGVPFLGGNGFIYLVDPAAKDTMTFLLQSSIRDFDITDGPEFVGVFLATEWGTYSPNGMYPFGDETDGRGFKCIPFGHRTNEPVVLVHPPVDSTTPTPPTPTTPPVSNSNITINIRVRALPANQDATINVRVNVFPAKTLLEGRTESFPTSLFCVPIPIPAKNSIIAELHNKIGNKVASFYDEDRALKTLLNFGNDYQAMITNWKYDPDDASQSTLLAKLYRPLPEDVVEKKTVWISREITPTIIDRVHTVFIPDAPTLLYLRPPNKSIDITGRSGHSISNVTSENLFSSSLFDIIMPSDPVLEEWFTFDVNSSELNVDYSDYRNFVFFSSAEERLNAFRQKMATIENLTNILLLHSASLNGTGSAHITGSNVYTALENIAAQRLDTLRSFDGYERFLYYSTDIPYSASLTTNDYQDLLFYNDDATWPKTGTNNVTVSAAASWFADQVAIAREYDRYNQDRLANNLPEYLRSDSNSSEFLKFMDMVGHQVDLVKQYIKQMSLMYDRSNSATEGMSQDVVWNVADSFGVDLPNQYAIKNLVDYTIGEVGVVSPTVYREAATETWKRFLHNHIFLMKAKGTKAALRGLSNVYGILPTTLQIREATTPGFSYLTGSYEIFEEQTNSLIFNTGSYVAVPWYTGSMTPQTLEVRFATTQTSSSVLLNAHSNLWAMVLSPLTGSFAKVELKNASNATVVSSSYLELFSGDFYTAMLRNDSTGVTLAVKKAYQDDLIDESVTTSTSGTIQWMTPSTVYLGGSGSFFGRPDWAGQIDEVRVWGELITSATFDLHVRYAGMYNGNTSTSARDYLYTRLSFNTPVNLFVTSSLTNETPYIITNPIAVVQTIPAIGFASIATFPYNMSVNTREVQRFAPNAGGSQFTTNKVVIADPPVLKYMTFASSSAQVPVLSRNQSIVSLRDKDNRPKAINTVGFYFSLTDAINDNIIRSIGNIDLQNLIGDPADQYSSQYADLFALSSIYWTSYAYSYNTTSFIDFVKNLLDPLFKQARKLLPVRAKLLGGIVHEPHILERSKAPLRPMKMYAGRYGKYLNQSVNLDSAIIRDMVEPLGSFNQYTGIADTTEIFLPVATYTDKKVTLDTSDVLVPVATYANYRTTLDTSEVLQPISTYNQYTSPALELRDVVMPSSNIAIFNDFTNKIAIRQAILERFNVTSTIQLTGNQYTQYKNALLASQNLNAVNIGDILDHAKDLALQALPTGTALTNMISPSTNFDNIESHTYFTHPLGHIAQTAYVQVRRRESSLTSRGAWATGSVYSRDDYVTATNTNGSTIEWVCTTNASSFTSLIPPVYDTDNWKSMQYVTEERQIIKKVVSIGSTVSIVSTGSAYTGIVGYHPTHYKFTRDYRLGIIRHQWLGCKQTDDTTPDGNPVVEVLPSAGDILVVNDPGAPIQPISNNAGPILDIR
jgi:hypothetical protein